MKRLAYAGACITPLGSASPVLAELTSEKVSVAASRKEVIDKVNTRFTFQAATQAAGTPNQSGLSAFIPLRRFSSGLIYADIQGSVNFADFDEYSSIINTEVGAGTFFNL